MKAARGGLEACLRKSSLGRMPWGREGTRFQPPRLSQLSMLASMLASLCMHSRLGVTGDGVPGASRRNPGISAPANPSASCSLSSSSHASNPICATSSLPTASAKEGRASESLCQHCSKSFVRAGGMWRRSGGRRFCTTAATAQHTSTRAPERTQGHTGLAQLHSTERKLLPRVTGESGALQKTGQCD